MRVTPLRILMIDRYIRTVPAGVTWAVIGIIAFIFVLMSQ